ncbi:hypothetical protein [Citreimonas salinaria]|uniref:Formate dehydrogenase region TAT target n=1 Tax=Citreimonas salinaria TaxID=321339 RepID=A0A1H3KBX6_9RHOB|nr:hypothetical protein [Citreimonas salinaria]SDY49215.1 formate dehydrogenase region TAT target [Citreimonas salinaria]
MSKFDNRKNATRRDLLKIAPLAGAAAVAGNAAGADAAPADTSADDHRQVRLADSDHVRTYYKLARE